ncbi:hypothetical protein J2Z30_008893 [Streptomyces iranensis]|uniref:Uncharacterized protein n=1 Tax=Streptomyces iranensis TaxID=576784 RepID=A0ABS4N725_9ACTN|nr:hypothetical protein [Streptomyces iranensis]
MRRSVRQPPGSRGEAPCHAAEPRIDAAGRGGVGESIHLRLRRVVRRTPCSPYGCRRGAIRLPREADGAVGRGPHALTAVRAAVKGYAGAAAASIGVPMSLRGSACSCPPPRAGPRLRGEARRAYGVSVRGLCGPPPLKGACGRFAVSLRRSVRGLCGRPPPAGGSMASVGSAAPLRTSAGPTAVPRGLCGRHGSVLTVVPASSGRSAASRRPCGCPRGPRSRPSTSLHPYRGPQGPRLLRVAPAAGPRPTASYGVLRRPTATASYGGRRRSRRPCGGHGRQRAARAAVCALAEARRVCGCPRRPPPAVGALTEAPAPRTEALAPIRRPVRGTHPATGARGSPGLRCTPAAPRPRPAVR